MDINKNTSKILVVLCPGDPLGDYSFEDIPKNEDKYLGGDIRMRAAFRIANKYPLIIVVGGSKEKVAGMKLFLIREAINAQKIIRLESNPDTNGNLNALRKLFDHYEKLEKYSVDILSNDYHKERVKTMAFSILDGISWEFISADDIVKIESEITKGMHSKQLKNRKKSEDQGIKDWQEKKYENQGIEPWQFKSIIYDHELFNQFLGSEITKMFSTKILFEKLISQIEVGFLFFIEEYLSKNKAYDSAGARCLQLLISYHFELLLKARFISDKTFSSNEEAIEVLRGLGHDLEKIGQKMGRELNDIGIKKIYKDNNGSYIVEIEQGKDIYIEDFTKIRYDFLEGRMRYLNQADDQIIRGNLNSIKRIIEIVKNN